MADRSAKPTRRRRRRKRDWVPPGPLRELARRYDGMVERDKPRILLAVVDDIELWVTAGGRPTMLAHWQDGKCPPAPATRADPAAAVDEVTGAVLGVVTADWHGIRLAFGQRERDVEVLDRAMHRLARYAAYRGDEVRLLRGLPGARPREPHDFNYRYSEPEFNPPYHVGVSFATEPVVHATLCWDRARIALTVGGAMPYRARIDTFEIGEGGDVTPPSARFPPTRAGPLSIGPARLAVHGAHATLYLEPPLEAARIAFAIAWLAETVVSPTTSE